MVDTKTNTLSKFEYIRPGNIYEAIQCLNDPRYNNRILSGGTDLMVALRGGATNFNRVVDVSRIPAVKVIEKEGQQITLGAGVTFSEIIESDLLNQEVPFLVEASKLVGSPQIRNLGTIGGNVANAASCADSLPVLLCLDAVAHLSSSETNRQIPVSQMVTAPNRTMIQSGELLTHFTFISLPIGVITVFLKLGRRNAQAISRLTVAAVGGVDSQGCINLARIAPGAATPVPCRLQEVEKTLLGEPPTSDLFAKAAQQAADVIIAISGRRWSTEYKEKAVTGMMGRALTSLYLEK